MANKGKDLFELLQLRDSSGGALRRRPPSTSGKGTGGQSRLHEIALWLLELLPRRRSPARRRPHGRGRRAVGPGAGIAIPGPWLAALILGALGAGFLLGRGTAHVGVAQDLRADAGPRSAAIRPGRMLDEAPDLSAEQEVEQLSEWALQILHFPAHQRERASDLARYLRRNGIETARIRLFPDVTSLNGADRWCTLVYVPSPDDKGAILRELLQVPPPPGLEAPFQEVISRDRLIRLQS